MQTTQIETAKGHKDILRGWVLKQSVEAGSNDIVINGCVLTSACYVKNGCHLQLQVIITIEV